MSTIREAKPTDKDELLTMGLALQWHDEASNPRIWKVTEEGKRRIDTTVDEMLSDEEGIAIVAEENGKPVGFAWGHVVHRTDYTPKAVGFIRLIYLKEEYRRRGTGTRMVWEICRFFRAKGVEEVNLNYILGNREGEGFWRGLGFEPVRVSANTPLKALEERIKQRTTE